MSKTVTVTRTYGAAREQTSFDLVLNDDPVTYGSLHLALQDTFSSPIQSYSVEPDSSGTVWVSHPKSYSSRTHGKRLAIEQLVDRVKALEDNIKVHEVVLLNLLEWETADRLTQAINDYAIEHYLDRYTSVTIQNSKFSYLPRLLSIWWYSWNSRSPQDYPLPEGLQNLSESAEVHCAALMFKIEQNPDLDDAASAAWDAIPTRLSNLMLKLYTMRDIGSRNNFPHPTLTLEFASEFLSNPETPLSSPERSLALQLLKTATLKPKARDPKNPNYAFSTTGDREQGGSRLMGWDEVLAVELT